MNLLKRFKGDEDGGIAVLFALAAVPVLLFAGAAVDYARALDEQTDMQAAIDSAVLAAALEPDATKHAAVALAIYNANARNMNRTDAPPVFWTEAADNTFRGTLTATVPMTLMQLGGFRTVTLSVGAAASLGGDPVCMLLVKPTGTALTMNSSSEINMPACEVHVKSTSQDAVIMNSNSEVNSRELCVAGKIIINSGTRKSTYKEGCKPVSTLPATPAMAPDSYCTYTSKLFKNGSHNQAASRIGSRLHGNRLLPLQLHLSFAM
jgi:Flp pilus assembly protein TadG